MFEPSADPAVCHEESFLLGTDAPHTAAASSGLTLLSTCGEGVCGTCTSTLLSADAAPGRREPAAGDRRGQDLLCCSRPYTGLMIDA